MSKPRFGTFALCLTLIILSMVTVALWRVAWRMEKTAKILKQETRVIENFERWIVEHSTNHTTASYFGGRVPVAYKKGPHGPVLDLDSWDTRKNVSWDRRKYRVSFSATPSKEKQSKLLKTIVRYNPHFCGAWDEQSIPNFLRVTVTRRRDGKSESHDFS